MNQPETYLEGYFILVSGVIPLCFFSYQNLALVSVRTPGDVMRSDLWAALRDPAFLQFSKGSHTLSTMKMTTSTHPPPHPALRLWLETQHANPACSNRLVGVTFKSSYWLYPSSFSLYIHYIEPPNPGVLLKCAATTHPLIPPPTHTHMQTHTTFLLAV